MIPELQPLPEGRHPQPGDLIQLHAAATTYLVVEPAGEPDGDNLEINHLPHHPQHPDWATVVRVCDVATVTRHTPTGPHTWTLTH